MKTENNDTTAQSEELEKLVDRIRRHQDALGLSDKLFVDRYRTYLGSEKTWRNRLCEADYKDMAVGKRLALLRTMVGLIDGGSRLEEVFEDMPIYQGFDRRLRLLKGTTNDRRCMVMLAETGCGKSVCGKTAYQANPREVAYMQCWPTYKGRTLRILNGMAAALGVADSGVASEVLARVIETLKSQPITFIIDEAHECGVEIFKIVKLLIDQTPSRFVLLGFPTLWNGLVRKSSDVWAEARQLYGRTKKPIYDDYAKGTTVEDVACLLRHCLGFNGHSTDVAQEILPTVIKNGNLRHVCDVIDTCETMAQEDGIDVDGKLVIKLSQTYAMKGLSV